MSVVTVYNRTNISTRDVEHVHNEFKKIEPILECVDFSKKSIVLKEKIDGKAHLMQGDRVKSSGDFYFITESIGTRSHAFAKNGNEELGIDFAGVRRERYGFFDTVIVWEGKFLPECK